jgi:hypothetical protein
VLANFGRPAGDVETLLARDQEARALARRTIDQGSIAPIASATPRPIR